VWDRDNAIWEEPPSASSPSTERIAAQSDAYLAEVGSREEFGGLAVSREVRIGRPSDQIADIAAHPETRMVVLTSHGRSGIKRFIQGSVADHLVRTVAVPLFIVRPGGTAPPIERMLVTVDGSETSEKALAPARAVADASGAELHLLRVANPLAEMPYTALAPAPDLGDLSKQVFEAADEYLRITVREGEHFEVRAGRPLDVILDYAKEKDCRVIAMGTHGRGGVLRLALGSTTDAVMRAADRPVLIIPDHRK
jgi:nucleotide-binding universal stress UspA family protein